MGATPMVGGRSEGAPMRTVQRKEAPVTTIHCESGAWGYVVHPSLLPTIFAPGGKIPVRDEAESPTARKV